MKFVVLGGAGDMGSHIAANLIEHSDAQVIIADYRLSRAQALARRLGERAEGIFVDAGNRDSLLLALRGADVAIGAAGPFFQLAPKTAWAAIESQVPYIDICDDHEPIDVLYEFDIVARKAGVTLITGLGWTPGLSNILARRGADRLDRVDEIRIAWVGSAADSQGLAVVKHVLYTISGNVPTYRDGGWTKVPALTEPEVVEFPEPLGKIKVSHVGHPEPLTIPRTISAQTVTLKGALTPAWNNRLAAILARMGLTSSERRIDRVSRLIHRFEGMLGAGGVPLSGVRVDVSGTRNNKPVTLTYSAADRMSRLTGIPVTIGAIMLAEGKIEEPGVFAPEAIIDPDPFLDRLAEHGIEIFEEEEEEPAEAVERTPARIKVEVPAEEAPDILSVPSARLSEGQIVEVVLDLDRGRPVETAPQEDISPSMPSAALHEGEIVEVALALNNEETKAVSQPSSPLREMFPVLEHELEVDESVGP